MNINDDDLVNSKLLVAKIRIEVLSHGETELIYRCERTVDQAHVRIKMMEFTVSNLDRNWNIPLKSVSYVCTVRFEYHGKFDRITHKMEKLMASARSATAMGSNTLASMLDDKTFTDFTFNIRGQEFKVHKCVMSAASDVMKNLITLGGCGSGETKKNSANFDCDPEIFNHLINFIYKSWRNIENLLWISSTILRIIMRSNCWRKSAWCSSKRSTKPMHSVHTSTV